MNVKIKSYLKSELKNIEKDNMNNLTKAAKHVVEKIKKNLSGRSKSNPGEFPGKNTGKLKKSAGYLKVGSKILVGTKSHSTLLEEGTKNMLPRPFLFRTFREVEEKVIEILRGED